MSKGELIGRLVIVEVQGVTARGNPGYMNSRSQALRCLIASLLGLLLVADRHEVVNSGDSPQKSGSMPARLHTPPSDNKASDRASRRTRISPDGWQDTLTLLCDNDYAVRADYAEALACYLTHEMPKYGDYTDAGGIKRVRRLAEGPLQQATAINILLHAGDSGTKFLHAIHAYLYILATTSSLGLTSSSSVSPSPSHSGSLRLNVVPATPLSDKHHVPDNSEVTESLVQAQSNGRRSFSAPLPRSRKLSVVQRLLERTPSRISTSASACLADYTHILSILTTVHEQLPVRGLLTGIPVLLALDAATKTQDMDDAGTLQRIETMREVTARVWLSLGKVWNSTELVEIAEKVCCCRIEMMNAHLSVPGLILVVRGNTFADHPTVKKRSLPRSSTWRQFPVSWSKISECSMGRHRYRGRTYCDYLQPERPRSHRTG